jgi:hypothetical protein
MLHLPSLRLQNTYNSLFYTPTPGISSNYHAPVRRTHRSPGYKKWVRSFHRSPSKEALLSKPAEANKKLGAVVAVHANLMAVHLPDLAAAAELAWKRTIDFFTEKGS